MSETNHAADQLVLRLEDGSAFALCDWGVGLGNENAANVFCDWLRETKDPALEDLAKFDAIKAKPEFKESFTVNLTNKIANLFVTHPPENADAYNAVATLLEVLRANPKACSLALKVHDAPSPDDDQEQEVADRVKSVSEPIVQALAAFETTLSRAIAELGEAVKAVAARPIELKRPPAVVTVQRRDGVLTATVTEAQA